MRFKKLFRENYSIKEYPLHTTQRKHGNNINGYISQEIHIEYDQKDWPYLIRAYEEFNADTTLTIKAYFLDTTGKKPKKTDPVWGIIINKEFVTERNLTYKEAMENVKKVINKIIQKAEEIKKNEI